MVDPLADLPRRLEDAAARLRAGDLDPETAATLVDECASMATAAAAELERQAREAAVAPGQTELL